jgi:hypothetical protein
MSEEPRARNGMPGLNRTETVDVVTLVSGELVLETEETTLMPGHRRPARHQPCVAQPDRRLLSDRRGTDVSQELGKDEAEPVGRDDARSHHGGAAAPGSRPLGDHQFLLLFTSGNTALPGAPRARFAMQTRSDPEDLPHGAESHCCSFARGVEE